MPGFFGGNLVGEAIDPVDQDAREQEIREDDDAFIAQLGHVVQAGFNQWEGHAGIAHLQPAKAHAFLQQTRHFGGRCRWHRGPKHRAR